MPHVSRALPHAGRALLPATRALLHGRRARARALPRGERERRVVDRDVDFRLVEDDRLAARPSGRSCLVREREEHAVHALVIAEVGLELRLGAADGVLVADPDDQEVVRVEEDRQRVAVLLRHADLVGVGAVDVLGAQVGERRFLRRRIDERAVEIGVVDESLVVVAGGALRVLAPSERGHLPAFAAVPGLDAREPLRRVLEPRLARALHHLRVGHLEPASAEDQLAGQAERLHGAELVEAAARLHVLLHQLLDRQRGRPGAGEDHG